MTLPENQKNPALSRFQDRIVFLCVVAVFTEIFFLVLIYATMDSNHPRFGVGSALVSIDNNINTAEWDLEFFVRNSNKKYDYHYRQFEVYFQSMSQDWLMAANVGPFGQGSKNTTLVSANVKTLLPAGYNLAPSTPGGVAWEMAVMWRAKLNGDKVVQAFCRNMKVVFAQNATKGLLVGGPVTCPLEKISN